MLKKIRDFTDCFKKKCRDPHHNPPNMMVYTPGEYERTCPKCGHISRFTIPSKYWNYTRNTHCSDRRM